MLDYEEMIKFYTQAGGSPEIFKNSNIAHLIVHKNKVIGKNLVEGLILEPIETESGVDINLKIEEGIKIANPVHLCFGILPKEGEQQINIKVEVEKNAEIKILAHCIFPNAVKIVHKMNAEIEIKENAYYRYDEIHYHGEFGGVEVIPKAKVLIGKNSKFFTNFSLLKGRVGIFELDYFAVVEEKSVLEMVTKIYGYGNDKIKVIEKGRLKGKESRGLLKSRIAVKDKAESEVINELTAEGDFSRGHIDCVEVIQGEAKAKALPIVNVINQFANVTHEAAIGRVDKKQIETLMARGLDEESAIDLIIKGMLK